MQSTAQDIYSNINLPLERTIKKYIIINPSTGYNVYMFPIEKCTYNGNLGNILCNRDDLFLKQLINHTFSFIDF